jgi:chloramphenicol 3-O-phosphotransferase
MDMDWVLQISAAVGVCEPTRHERMQLARLQAETGIDAIKADDVKAARDFLVHSLDHLEQIKP